ncbi:MAG: DUF6090 family protein [Flavobacteriales bacterium]
MLKENRFTRYLLYAIGEIALVMIGILLALQVNNWNEGRKRSVQEQKILKELLRNLHMDSLDHAGNRDWSLDIGASADHIVNGLEARRPWQNSMSLHYGRILIHGVATLNTSAYDNLKSIGFDLIRNDSIRIAITKLYSLDITRLLKLEKEMLSEDQVHNILPVVLKRVRINRPWWDSTPHDYEGLMDDLEFQTAVRWKAVTNNHIAGEYEIARKETSRLMAMIERELAKTEDP